MSYPRKMCFIVRVLLKGTLNTSIVEERAQCAPRNQNMGNTECVMSRVAEKRRDVFSLVNVRGQSPLI